jgi:hypothetical protein
MNISRVSKRLRAFFVGITAIISFGSVSIALAVPSQRITVDPEPEVPFAVADCVWFEAMATSTFNGHFILHFDKDGNLIRVNQHLNFRDSIYFNSVIPTVSIPGGPGENINQVFYIDPDTGSTVTFTVISLTFKATIPGHGVIVHEAGRFVIDAVAGEVLFQAGPADIDEGDTAALCEALTPV